MLKMKILKPYFREVIEALPELIKLHRAVVKDVFYRLLGVQRGDISGGVQVVAPLTAVELLIELHKMDGGSVKNSIDAIALCLAEKQVFTLEGKFDIRNSIFFFIKFIFLKQKNSKKNQNVVFLGQHKAFGTHH